jgi:putative transcriptional regulator
MSTNSRKPLFERLKAGLEEGIAHAKGELSLKTVEIPEKPPEIDAHTLAALREAAEMSQAIFAKVLNVSAKTVQSWEQGVRVPSMASRRLIQVFSERPEVVCEIVGLRPVKLKGVRVVQSGGGKWKIVFSGKKVPQKRTKTA